MSGEPSRETEKEPSADTTAKGAPASESGAALDLKADAKSQAKADGKTPSKPDAKASAAPKREAASPAARVSAAAAAKAFQIDEGQPTGLFARLTRQVVRQTPSWLVSMVVHVVVILALALLSLPPPVLDEARQLVVAPSTDQQLEDVEEFDQEPLEQIDFQVVPDMVFESQVEPEQIDTSPFDDMESAAATYKLEDFGIATAPQADLLNQVGSFSGSALDGRGSGKARLVASSGGNDKSERAVALALQWLARHQMVDGGWSFNHTLAPSCGGQCRNPGNIPEARNGATGLALLPFLGAGQTHKTGEYKDLVKAGLYFLVNNMKVSAQGGSLYESGGSMYSHGIASIVLCEAYAMTHDKGLYAPAQQSLNFIAYAQDPVGGGWRYSPRQAGDTSVVGWQIMAMKSGHMGYLRVPPITVQKASRFLDSVQANNGAHYGYTDPAANRDGTTAVGLLCRMYLGWKQDNPALERGVKWISDKGPSPTNMYYNYYATQVMRHWGGEPWKKWNSVMRDQLVKSQAQKGHEEGSWFMPAGHVTDKGGRLYCTAMAAMILEVYYRHLPIYRKQSTEETFPLD